jgi:hypothetical protein
MSPFATRNDQEALHPGALVSELPNAIAGHLSDLLADHRIAARVGGTRALLAVGDMFGADSCR